MAGLGLRALATERGRPLAASGRDAAQPRRPPRSPPLVSLGLQLATLAHGNAGAWALPGGAPHGEQPGMRLCLSRAARYHGAARSTRARCRSCSCVRVDWGVYPLWGVGT